MGQPSDPSFSHFKKICVCCEETGKKMNKEHLYPKWLLKHTNNDAIKFRSPNGEIPAINYTVPLCAECNSLLGEKLEKPVSAIFKSIENDLGFNDYEAELIIRWLWKIQGMFYWSICNDSWKYAPISLKKRVLSPIEAPRSRLSIGIALIKDENENDCYGYAPVGLDTFSLWSNIFVAGVFSKISVVVFHTAFKDYIDDNIWTIYTLSDYPLMMNRNKKVFPKCSIDTGTNAIILTKLHYGPGSKMLRLHDEASLKNSV